MSFQSIRLSLSDTQRRNLMKGLTVQVTNGSINVGEPFAFSVRNNNKLIKALENGKGVRINLTQQELKENKDKVGAGFGSVMKKARKVGNKIQKNSNKVTKGIAKADKIVGKIDRALDKADFIEDMGIPIVSDAYAGIHTGADKLHSATSSAKRVSQAGNDFVQDPRLSKLNKATRVANEEYENNTKGSGVNPYMPTRKKVKGGSFRAIGGSFKPMGSGVRVFNDNSNFIKPGHNSFKPVPPPRYSA